MSISYEFLPVYESEPGARPGPAAWERNCVLSDARPPAHRQVKSTQRILASETSEIRHKIFHLAVTQAPSTDKSHYFAGQGRNENPTPVSSELLLLL